MSDAYKEALKNFSTDALLRRLQFADSVVKRLIGSPYAYDPVEEALWASTYNDVEEELIVRGYYD